MERKARAGLGLVLATEGQRGNKLYCIYYGFTIQPTQAEADVAWLILGTVENM